MIWALLPLAAASDDVPHLWVRSFGAIVVNPAGVMVDGAVEARAPVLRLGGAAFNRTFVGAGARVALTPVHAEVALRTSFQPIDLLPVTVEAFYAGFWESPWGFIPTDVVFPNDVPGRRPAYQADRDFAATAVGVNLSPTFQIAYGRFAAFTNGTWTWMRVDAPDNPERWVFEPFRGTVISPEERLFEHNSAVVVQALDGEDKPLLRVGAVARGRTVATTPDVTLQLGALMQYRPGKRDQDVNLTLMCAWYAQDPDFLGPLPFIAAVFTSAKPIPFRKRPKGPADARLPDVVRALPM